MKQPSGQATQLRIRNAKKFKLHPHPGWLEEPYFPRARLTLLDGKEKIGKGLRCAGLAARVAANGINVLWMSAEDDPEFDIYPRMLACGWDQEHCPGQLYFGEGLMKFPIALDELAAYLSSLKIELLILDPGRSYLANPLTGESRYSSEEDVRPGLEALGRLCIRQSVTGVFVHHWNRDSQRDASDRYSGSGAFAQVVRHRVSMAWSKTSGTGGTAVVDSNVARKGAVRGYRIVEVPEYNTARFEIGQPLPFEELDHWVRYTSKPIEIVLDPGEMLEEWLVHHAEEYGGVVPARDELRELVPHMTRAKVIQALSDLQDRGLITKEGKRLMWRGHRAVDLADHSE